MLISQFWQQSQTGILLSNKCYFFYMCKQIFSKVPISLYFVRPKRSSGNYYVTFLCTENPGLSKAVWAGNQIFVTSSKMGKIIHPRFYIRETFKIRKRRQDKDLKTLFVSLNQVIVSFALERQKLQNYRSQIQAQIYLGFFYSLNVGCKLQTFLIF